MVQDDPTQNDGDIDSFGTLGGLGSWAVPTGAQFVYTAVDPRELPAPPPRRSANRRGKRKVRSTPTGDSESRLGWKAWRSHRHPAPAVRALRGRRPRQPRLTYSTGGLTACEAHDEGRNSS